METLNWGSTVITFHCRGKVVLKVNSLVIKLKWVKGNNIL
jgi:hypothetical protein